MIGDKIAKFESGAKGTAAISTGAGDPGGVSYGKYQLASKTGTLQSFLKQSGYDSVFHGLTPGTQPFNDKWLSLAHNQSFKEAENQFIVDTHYKPVEDHASQLGIPVDNDMIKEALFSMSVQHSGANSIVDKAVRSLQGRDNLTDKDVLKALYSARSNYVSNLKTLSAPIKASILNRYRDEEELLIEGLT